MKEETLYEDSHYLKGRVVILRPLRDFLDTEILLYNHINNIPILNYGYFFDIKIRANFPFKGNTNNLLYSFLQGLQVNSENNKE